MKPQAMLRRECKRSADECQPQEEIQRLSPRAEQTSSTKSFRRSMTDGELTVSTAMFRTVFSTATAVSHPASACSNTFAMQALDHALIADW